MSELPGTCDAQHYDLDQGPADDTGVGGFGLITEFGFSFLEAGSVS